MAPPTSRRIKLSTGLIHHVLLWNDGDAQKDHTVVLLHGFLDLCWTWEKVVASGLGDRYHVVAPDLRGHGDTDRIGAGGYYHFMDYLADVHDLLDKVRAERTALVGKPPRVSLVGHSMGGAVASYYAGSYPEEIFRLAVLEGLGPPEHKFETMPDRVRLWIAAWRRAVANPQRPLADVAEAAERLRRHDRLLDEKLALRLAELGTTALPDGKRVWKHDPLHLTSGPWPFSLTIAEAFWRRIKCKTLLVGAKESELSYTEEELTRRTSQFADARLELLDGAGHMMQRHQPAALGKLLCEFLG